MRCLAANRLRVRHLHNVVRLQHLIKDTLLAVWVCAKQFVVLHFMEHRLVVEVWLELAGHVVERGHRVTVHEACRDMHLSSFAFGVGLDQLVQGDYISDVVCFYFALNDFGICLLSKLLGVTPLNFLLSRFA